jgi:hypothetical protein
VIGYISTSGTIVQVETSQIGIGRLAGPIVAGSDGALWFLDGTVERCTTHFVCTSYPLPVDFADYYATLAEGPDGAIWIAAAQATGPLWMLRLSTDGVYTSYPLPSISPPLSQIAAGQDGALWFGARGVIIRVTTSGVATEYPMPNPNAVFSGMVQGPGGVWFSEFELLDQQAPGSRMGAVLPLSASLTVEPPDFKPRDTITLTGSGYAPGETVNLRYSSDIGKALPAAAMADSTGAFTITGEAGPAVFGDGSVTAFGQSSGNVGVATVLVMPGLILSPTSGSVGDTITASGGGFQAYDFYGTALLGLFWLDPNVPLGAATVDSLGEITGFTFTIPAGAAPGQHLVFESIYGFDVGQLAPDGSAGAYINVLASSPSQ